MSDDQTKHLRKRLSEIEDQIAALQDEAQEIGVALRVIEKYTPPEVRTSAVDVKGKPRPEGIPTIFEMVAFVLKEAGNEGLTAGQIVERVRLRYWPGLANAQFQPSLYRFKKEGRLIKSGNRFRLPRIRIRLPGTSDQGTMELEPEVAASGSNTGLR